MKFGRKLIEMRISKWAPYYIDYQELKYILKSHLPKEQQTEDDEGEDEKLALDLEGKLDLKIRGVSGTMRYGSHQPERSISKMSQDFFTKLEEEINCVEGLYKSVLKSLQSQLDQAKLIYHDDHPFSNTNAKTKAISALAHHINHDINELVTFVELNKVAVRKIAKKYSKITKQPVEKQVVSAVERVRKFMCPKRLYSLREEAERFLSSVSKSAYRKAFTSVV